MLVELVMRLTRLLVYCQHLALCFFVQWMISISSNAVMLRSTSAFTQFSLCVVHLSVVTGN